MALDRQVFKSFSDAVRKKVEKEDPSTRGDPSVEALPDEAMSTRLPINTGLQKR